MYYIPVNVSHSKPAKQKYKTRTISSLFMLKQMEQELVTPLLCIHFIDSMCHTHLWYPMWLVMNIYIYIRFSFFFLLLKIDSILSFKYQGNCALFSSVFCIEKHTEVQNNWKCWYEKNQLKPLVCLTYFYWLYILWVNSAQNRH